MNDVLVLKDARVETHGDASGEPPVETSVDALAIIASTTKIELVEAGKLCFDRQLSTKIHTTIGSLEAVLFIIKVLEHYPSVNRIRLESTKLAFIASYCTQVLKIPYSIGSNIAQLPARDWYMIFNATECENTELLKNTYLPADFTPVVERGILPCGEGLKIAIVAYYSAPFMRVGSKRVEFFNRFFNQQQGVSCKIISAIPMGGEAHIYVPDFSFDSLNRCTDRQIQALINNRTDVTGASWSRSLKAFFDAQSAAHVKLPDVVLFSGNPFYYFDVAAYLKNAYGVYTVLDYRDAFVNNPLMLHGERIKEIQRELEHDYNDNADLILTPNGASIELLVGDHVSSKALAIKNGYDDALYHNLPPKQAIDLASIRFVYAGTLGKFINSKLFSSALKITTHCLTYMGSNDEFGKDNSNIHRLGFVASEVAAAEIAKHDVGVVFALGENGEGNTKIYDYIGAQLPILIITDGELYTGTYYILTQDLDGVFWVKNTASEIIKFLKGFAPVVLERSQRQDFSRSAQAQILLKKIKEDIENE